MSTDSSELTFVRCPSCRSLVPAVSTRCRMCGASLESSGAVAEEEKPVQKPRRVRQRTMSSGTDNSFAEATDRVRAESEAVEEAPVDEVAEFAAAEESAAEEAAAEEAAPDALSDPLGAFLGEEQEVEEQVLAKEPVSEDLEATAQLEPSMIEEAEAEAGEEDLPEEEDPAVEEELAAPEEEIVEEEPEEEEVKEEEEAVEEVVEEQETEEVELAAEPESTVVVETGGRSRGKKRRLSFSREVEEPQEDTIVQERPEAEAETEEEPELDFEEEVEPEEEAVEIPKKPSRGRDRIHETRSRSSADRPAVSSDAEGRLFGWLVSYADPQGSAIELREGKYFVSSKPLKGNELIIDDESVSTPHALMTVGSELGLHIQDLLSENGVYLKKRHEDSFSRQEETVAVENGDWIRLGDSEFIVSLIPYVGVK